MEPKCNFLTTTSVPWIVLYYFTLVFVSIPWSWLTRVRDLIEIVYKAYLWEETKTVSDTTEETVNEFIGYQRLVIHIYRRSWDILKNLPDASSSKETVRPFATISFFSSWTHRATYPTLDTMISVVLTNIGWTIFVNYTQDRYLTFTHRGYVMVNGIWFAVLPE